MRRGSSVRACAAVVLAIVAAGCSSDPTSTDTSHDPPSTATPTSVGTVSGTAATATIGAAGGSLTSADGLLTLTIPAGALSANTSISIQPITNMAWGGTGSGYRLSPDGLTFTTPVTLAFQVDAGALDGSAPEFMKVATQGQDGLWYVLKDRTYDDVTRTLTTRTRHFSDYSTVLGVQLRPASAAVDFQGRITLRVEYCYDAAAAGDPELVSLVYTCDDGGSDPIAPLGTFSNWSVNGIAGGSGSVGSVTPAAQTDQQATYYAPALTPPTNPVRVTVQATIGGQTKTLVANITVGTEWVGTGTSWVSVGTGNPNDTDRMDFSVKWSLVGSYNGMDIFVATGTITKVKRYFDPTCPELSLVPDNGPLLAPPEGGQMIIDHSTTPATIRIVTIIGHWAAQLTTQCATDPPETVTIQAGGGLATDHNVTMSADGKSIIGNFLDDVTGDAFAFTFTRRAPTP
jgi:hypothetical protein